MGVGTKRSGGPKDLDWSLDSQQEQQWVCLVPAEGIQTSTLVMGYAKRPKFVLQSLCGATHTVGKENRWKDLQTRTATWKGIWCYGRRGFTKAFALFVRIRL